MKNDRKAVSTLLGGLVMILIVTTVIASFFAYQQQFNSRYQTVARQVNDHEREMNLERMNLFPKIDLSNNILIDVTNSGSNPLRIVAVFTDSGLSNDLTANPETINEGMTSPIDAQTTYSGTGSVTIKILTERGNTASTIYPVPSPNRGGNNQEGASFVGPLKLEFSSFSYYKVNAPGNKVHDLVLGSKAPAYTIDTGSLTGNYIAFSLEISNQDPDERTIVLDRFTDLFDAQIGSANTQVWHMATIDAVGNLALYQDITLNFGDTVTLWFVTRSPASDDGSKAFSPGTQVASFLIFHGTIGGAAWGQNSPFVTSVFV